MGASRSVKGLEDDLDYVRNQMDDEARHHHVSFSDVLNSPLYKSWIGGCRSSDDAGLNDIMNGKNNILQNFKKPPKELLSKILFEMGLDIEKPIDELVCKHRNFNGDAVHTVRYSGSLRSDSTFVRWYRKNVLGLR